MALIPVDTDAELVLLRGPQPLPEYAGETFSALRGFFRRGCDWNTLVALAVAMPRLAERLRALGRFYVRFLPPRPPAGHPDPKRDIRAAAFTLQRLSALLTEVENLAQALPWGLDASLGAATALADTRSLQEWAAWIGAMERQVESVARVAALLQSDMDEERKRKHDDDAPDPKRAARGDDASE